jgi:hypothetical protein
MKQSFRLLSNPEKGLSNNAFYYKCRNLLFLSFFIVLTVTVLSSCKTKSLWLRGNMHTHTFWSDGDDFPENVTKWYKENGYNFLVLTDHNVILEGERWRRFTENNSALLRYIKTYDTSWSEIRPDDKRKGFQQVRLKTLNEFRSMFEEPGKFLVIMGEEITSPYEVHLISFDLGKALPASEGSQIERSKMIREVLARVDDYRKQSGRNTYPALAHPNFRWAITAEMMLDNPSLRFFEVYNGFPEANNDGDRFRVSTDRIWDIVLTHRLSRGNGEVIYGLATDDTHNYFGGSAGPGKGWVMVRSKKLTPESILEAIDKGDFYATTGVVINSIQVKGKNIKVEIKSQEGVKYLTEFIGTRKGFNPASFPTVDSTGMEIPNTTRTYSDKIGEVLSSSEDPNPSYTFLGNELYVRVRITSTADQKDPITGKVLGKQRAWIQPQMSNKR